MSSADDTGHRNHAGGRLPTWCSSDPALSRPISVTSTARDSAVASAEIRAALADTDLAMVVLFSASSLSLRDLGARLRSDLPTDCVLSGCSTAGELCSDGYCSDSVIAVGFPRVGFRAAALKMRSLSRMRVSEWIGQIRALHDHFDPDRNRHLIGLLLVDGLSNLEDVLSVAIDAALPGVPVFGGSTGAGLNKRSGNILLDGEADTDAAVFCLLESELVVQHVIIDHFRSIGGDMVVTAARPELRILDEINAEPAADEYSRLVGVSRSELSPFVFAEHPLIVQINGRNYVRAIRSQTDDGALVLMSAVETGTVLQLGLAEDLAGGFERALLALPSQPLLTLSFDCVLRRLAVERAGLSEHFRRIFGRFNIAGFNTYGEQHGGMHVNQTFVGLAFMPEKAADAPIR